MNPARKRKARLVVALGTAVLLAVALIYTSFASATKAVEPSELLENAVPGVSYTMTGEVVAESIRRQGNGIAFEVTDIDGGEGAASAGETLAATYRGAIPDPFRDGREIILTGEMRDGIFVGETDTLITKCPSKFEEDDEVWVGPDEVEEWRSNP